MSLVLKIRQAVRNNVEISSQIKSDGFKSYNGLLNTGYAVDMIKLGDPEKASELFKNVHILFSNIKSIIKGVHTKGIKLKYLPNYIAEFIYKYNRRWNEDLTFSRCLFAGLLNKSITLTELRA